MKTYSRGGCLGGGSGSLGGGRGCRSLGGGRGRLSRGGSTVVGRRPLKDCCNELGIRTYAALPPVVVCPEAGVKHL